MRRLRHQLAIERKIVMLGKTTFDRNFLARNARRLLVVWLVGGIYAMFGGVLWAAFSEFGNQSLRDRTPLVAADRTPLKLVPEDRTQGGTAAVGRSDAKTALYAPRPTSPIGGGRPAMSRRSEAEQGSDGLAAIDGPDLARHETAPAPAADDLTSEAWLLAIAPKSPLEADATASPATVARAVSVRASQLDSGAEAPPTPAFKPLDLVPIVMAEAAPAEGRGRATSRSRARNADPPKPSLKPITMPSKERPERAGEPDAPRVAATGQTLPQALRAFWGNLKILLASGPGPRIRAAGGDDSDRSDRQPSARTDLADASSGNAGQADRDGGSGTGQNGGSGGENDGTSGSGASSSSSAGNTSSGGESASSSSSAGDTSSRDGDSAGGQGDRSRDNDGRGARGGDDRDGDNGRGKDGDRGGRGDSRDGRGKDGDRGGGGGGKGGGKGRR